MNFKIWIEENVWQDESDGDCYWHADYDYQYGEEAIIEPKSTCGDVSLFPEQPEPKYGDKIHVVYITYNSGDSLGHSSGRRIHAWAFSDLEMASKYMQAIKQNAEDEDDHYFEFEGVRTFTGEWKGFFDSFTDAGILTFPFVKKRRRHKA